MVFLLHTIISMPKKQKVKQSCVIEAPTQAYGVEPSNSEYEKGTCITDT